MSDIETDSEAPEASPRIEILEPTAEEKSLILADELFPERLILVPLYDRPLFPKMMLPVVISNEQLEKLLLEELKQELKFIGLVYTRRDEEATPEGDPGEPASVGVIARIVQATKPQPNIPLHIVVQVQDRFDLKRVLSKKPLLRAKVSYWYDIANNENGEELKAYSLSVINIIKELVQLNPLFKEELGLLMGRFNLKEPGTLADFAASMTTSNGEELQKVLETRPIKKRIEQVLWLLRKELEVAQMQNRISKRIEERMSQQQREFFLREQLKEIKKELGLTKEGKDSELEKFEDRLKRLKLSDEALERVQEEMEKLRLIEPSSPEYNVSRAYLDWLTILPWGVYSKDRYDLKRARGILERDHHGLKDVKDRILELLSVGMVKGDLAGSIVLLVGPPGVGKTSIGQSVARAIGRKFFRFSLGGMRDEAEIKGHRRTYIGALPGKFINALKVTKTANPVIMLDEIDKIGASFQGDPASALLEVLDPEQNKDFLDHYLDVRFDLSKALFICTANTLDTIPGPLLDRMEIIRLSGYILEEKVQIAQKHLLPRQLKAHGLKRSQFQLPEAVLREIIDSYAREAGVRNLENLLKKLLRKTTLRIVEEEARKLRITSEDLPKMLGRKVFQEEDRYQTPRVGVVTGLAYTSMGGATLHIEATAVASKNPGFKQTGQLGEVMVESSEIAYTFLRSLLRDAPEAQKFLAEHLVHLHVPAGATPKDGPSAGITMACALYSLVQNAPIREGLAMTGELTLTGLVMPIGGVKEKTIAARRSGVRTLIFPEENRRDFEELDESIREGLEAHFVKEFSEVLQIGFPEVPSEKPPSRSARRKRSSFPESGSPPSRG